MVACEQLSILAVELDGLQAPLDWPLDLTLADSAPRAFELLRMLRFDLLLVGMRGDDAPPWSFVRKVRACRPRQKWMLLAANDLSAADEIIARSLGVTRIIEGELDCCNGCFIPLVGRMGKGHV